VLDKPAAGLTHPLQTGDKLTAISATATRTSGSVKAERGAPAFRFEETIVFITFCRLKPSNHHAISILDTKCPRNRSPPVLCGFGRLF